MSKIRSFDPKKHKEGDKNISLCETEVAQSCPTGFVSSWTVCSLPSFSGRGIFQARILEWFAIPSSGGRHEPLRKSQLSMKVKSLSRVRLFAVPWTLGFSVYGIFQARVLEWVAISFSRGSSQPRDRTWISHIAGRRFNL